MTINISTKNMSLDEPLRVFINEKIGGLEKLIPGGEIETHVEIGKPSRHHRSGEVFSAEANMKVGGKLLRAEASHVDLRAAIVDVKEELRIQINKFKERRKDLARKQKS